MPQLFLFGLFLMLIPKVVWSGYDLPDLEALAREGSYEEFFKHALDIRPSERLGPWKIMVIKMAEAHTQAIQSKSDIPREAFRKTEELYRWPVLQSDEIFKNRRKDIAFRYFKSCLRSEKPCWNEVKAFWETDNTDPDLAFHLAELIQQYPDAPIGIWPFLEVALKSPLSEFYCKKEFVMKTLWGKFEIDYIRLGPKGDLLKKIDQTLHPDCLPALNLEANTRLMDPDKAGDRELAFQILNAQGKIDQVKDDFFHIVYLLERPSQGELFNFAWNRLKELGRLSSRRDAVLNMMRILDPLPDDILTSLDQTKKRIVLTHFKANFPEYLDYYANQCIAFYGGKSPFPRGNPTMHCQDLMGSELGGKLLEATKIQEYQTIRKI